MKLPRKYDGLAESLHTAWRKGCEHRNATKIHNLITAMPEDHWLQYVHCVGTYLEHIGWTPPKVETT